MAATTIRSEVDLEAEGKQLGYLRVPHSTHRSAYGWIPVPIVSIRRGAGPKVVVIAGNHGDEYEGQIIASRLAREVTPEAVTGQLVIVTMANYPAAEAGLRVSPVDDGNLNRCFPGNPSGSATEVIAHYIETTLLAGADLVVDLHSGGSSLVYDGANMLALEPRSPKESEQVWTLLAAFGLDRAMLHVPNPVTISSATRRQGGISIVTELGGGGTVTPSVLRKAEAGVRHLLGHFGLLHGPLVPQHAPGTPRIMRIDAAYHYVFAREAGIFEPLVELGQRVSAGEPAARLHFPQTPSREPETYCFQSTGEVVCKRVPAKAQLGDCLFHLAEAA